GYSYLAVLNGATYALVLVAVVALNVKENATVHEVSRARLVRMHVPGCAVAGLSVLLVGLLAATVVLTYGWHPPTPTRHPPAGARRAAAPPAIALPPDRTFLGVYDPSAAATGTRLDAELAFVQWKPSAPDEVRQQIRQIQARHRVPFVTIEPYPWNVDGLTA